MTDTNLDIGIPMFTCFDRLNTFTSWKLGIPSAEKMAKAGFYFCGKRGSDTAKCFLCEKTLDCWEEEDDPWVEHKKHNAHCLYAKFGKVESELTLYQLIDLFEFYALKKLEKKNTEACAQVDKLINNAIKKYKKIVPS